MSGESFHADKEDQPEASRDPGLSVEVMAGLVDEIAHDFNNTLSGILGLTEIVMTRCLPPDSPAMSYLVDIVAASGRAKELTAQLHRLALSAREENRKEGSA